MCHTIGGCIPTHKVVRLTLKAKVMVHHLQMRAFCLWRDEVYSYGASYRANFSLQGGDVSLKSQLTSNTHMRMHQAWLLQPYRDTWIRNVQPSMLRNRWLACHIVCRVTAPG